MQFLKVILYALVRRYRQAETSYLDERGQCERQEAINEALSKGMPSMRYDFNGENVEWEITDFGSEDMFLMSQSESSRKAARILDKKARKASVYQTKEAREKAQKEREES